MVKMKEVADLAGVSQTTVSHVLNGRAAQFRIGVKTAERVNEAARKLGYRPSALARGFKDQRAYAIALAVGDLTNPFWTGVALGAQREAEKSGYSLVVFNTEEAIEREKRVIEMVRERRVDGAILSPVQLEDRQLADLKKEGLPFVLVDRYVEDLDAPSVVTDSLAGAELAIDHLAKQGHKRIGFVGGPPDISTFRDRRLGYLRALSRRSLTPGPEVTVPPSPELSEKAVRGLFRKRPAPTALFTANVWLTIGALRAAPDGVAIVGFDDLALADLLRRPITTVAQPIDELGSESVRLLLREMSNGGTARRVLLPPKLIVR